MSAGGVEITLRPAGDYVPMNTHYLFADLIYSAQQKMEVALGLCIDKDNQVLLNPSLNIHQQLTDKDKVIVLAPQLFR